MKRLVLLAMLSVGCTARQRPAAAGATSSFLEATLPDLAVHEPRPLTVVLEHCPMKTQTKGAPSCPFLPLASPGGAVRTMQKMSCDVRTISVPFVEDEAHLGLSILMAIVERGTSFAVPFFRLTDGTTLLLPDGLREPFLFHGRPGGLAYAPSARTTAFWFDGTCEVLERPLDSLVATTTGEVFGVMGAEYVQRRVDGSWVSLGPGRSQALARPTVQGPAVTIAQSTFNGRGLEAFAFFPDLARTEVVRRHPTFRPASYVGGVAPSPVKWGPSRFSLPFMADYDWERTGQLTLERPGAERRTLVTNGKRERGCDDGSDETRTSAFTLTSPSVVALSGARAIVATLERRTRCRFDEVDGDADQSSEFAPSMRSERRRRMTMLSDEATLVLYGVDEGSRELARVELKDRATGTTRDGVSIARRGDRLWAMAGGVLIEFDLAELEAAW